MRKGGSEAVRKGVRKGVRSEEWSEGVRNGVRKGSRAEVAAILKSYYIVGLVKQLTLSSLPSTPPLYTSSLYTYLHPEAGKHKYE